MKSLTRFFLLSFVIALLSGCAAQHPFMPAISSYNRGDFEQSEVLLKDFVHEKRAMKDVSYPLILLTLADSQFRLGDYRSALQSYDAAMKSLGAQKSMAGKAGRLLIAESRRPYKGRPHQFAFAHYYMGMCYFMMDEFDKANIEFAKSRLEDQGGELGQEDDIVCTIFMQGMTYLRLGELDKAIVDFRKVTELNPDFPLGWYEVAVISDKLGDKADGDWFWKKYEELVPKEHQMPRDFDANCIFVIIDTGKGPYRYAGSNDWVATEVMGSGFVSEIDLTALPDNSSEGFQTDTVGTQAATEGGKIEAGIKKGFVVIIKSIINEMLDTELFDLRPDTRMWYTLSGQVVMTMIPAEPGNYVLNIRFKEFIPKSRKKEATNIDVENLTLNWYYISSQKHSDIKPVYLVTKPYLHDTLTPRYKVQ
ncbi:MAG: tetratricopeptide repeat protein [Calditrichaeota bacterium]|nr:tetratricopeptide repeat protein [Calditrichota bacterium]